MTHTVVTRPTILGESRLDGGYFITKRLLDVLFSALLVLLIAPLLLLVALAIVVDTPGGALYVSERVGSRRTVRNGRVVWESRPFRFYKFRTMSSDSDTSIHEQHVRAYAAGTLEPDGSRAPFKLSEDARITRVGGVLRRTSIDELPQLLNVIRGEMSLVGPRPVPPYEVALYEERHLRRFATLPGITGLWQVSGRCSLTFDEMQALDAAYVERQSLRLDFAILLKTIPAVLSGRGAS
jgi:lipopolysaccharide/colanic/teichoic acid biosynthesis glycosyltransferase